MKSQYLFLVVVEILEVKIFFLVIGICVLLFVEKEKEKENYALCRLMIVLNFFFLIPTYKTIQ